MMEDPTARHVLPSRSNGSSAMPPPPPRRRNNKSVLHEDHYTAAMADIIERDFFPDLAKLQNQSLVPFIPQLRAWH
jgi:hypothetical protein